ncbi:hypothetical protein BDZ89DRAFT_1116699 [Hymenopellis radicata]|nr:hypothetical protein BDZ89DRAFT_1116699 [Hymenopellis radicata]
MVFIINGVDVEDYSWPYLGPIPRDYVSKYQATPNTEPRTPHSPVQRVIFGNDPFEFRSTSRQAFATRPSRTLGTLPLPSFDEQGPLLKPTNVDDFPPDYPPRSVEVVLPRLRTSVATVHPATSSNESVAELQSDVSTVAPSTVEELSFSAIPSAPSPRSQRRSSTVVAVRSARTAAHSSAKIAQATKAARLLGSISGPIRSRRSVRSNCTLRWASERRHTSILRIPQVAIHSRLIGASRILEDFVRLQLDKVTVFGTVIARGYRKELRPDGGLAQARVGNGLVSGRAICRSGRRKEMPAALADALSAGEWIYSTVISGYISYSPRTYAPLDRPPSSLFQWTPCNGSNCSCRNHAIPDFKEAEIPSLRDDARYHHLIHTNNVPAPAEEAAIRDMISDLHSRLSAARSSHEKLTKLRSDIMAQAAHISDCLLSLEGEQEHLSLAIEERKYLLSPVRRVPSEILSHIVSLTVIFPLPTKIKNSLETDSDEWRELLPSESMLWTVELVCKDWRRVVLQCPELWATLNVNLLDIDEKAILRLAVQLSRTGLANLSIGFYCCSSNVVDASATLSRIVFLLLPFASRITHLVLCMPLAMMLELSPFRNHLRVLKTLSVTCFSYNSGRVQVGIFEACPQLNSVTFVDTDDCLHFFALPWKAIQTFRTEHAYLSGYTYFNGSQPLQVLQVLKLAPHVRECHVRVESGRSPPDTEEELEGLPIICSHLSTLSVKIWPLADTHPVQETLEGIEAPALSKLFIETAGDSLKKPRDTAATFAAIQEFIQRSQAPLTTLHFSHGELAPDDVLRFLPLTPLLSELRLIDCGGLTNEVIEALTIKPDAPESLSLVPRLKTLHISGSLDFEPEVFTEMVKSRWKSTPLTTLDLGWFSGGEIVMEADQSQSEHVLRELSPYCMQGLILFTSSVA